MWKTNLMHRKNSIIYTNKNPVGTTVRSKTNFPKMIKNLSSHKKAKERGENKN